MTSARQPWLHEDVIVVRGNVTALSHADGQMRGDADAGPGGPSADGLFVDDRRVLHRLSVELGDEPLAVLAHAAVGAEAEYFLSARHLGDPGPDPTVEVHRRREVIDAGLEETVVVTSRARGRVRSTLILEVAGDGADIATVKGGLPGPAALPIEPLVEGVEGSERFEGMKASDGPQGAPWGVRWADARHRTSVSSRPAPASVEIIETAAGPLARLSYPVELDQSERLEVRLTVAAERVSGSDFDADAGFVRGAQLGDVEIEATDPRVSQTARVALSDLRHLLLTDPLAPGDVFAAAGTPWYLTLFGRDSLWTARLSLPFGTDLARGTLRTLARRQATATDPATAATPGKIAHEVRRTAYDTGVDSVEHLHLPPVYYGTIDATPLWLCLLHDAWRWGLAESEVRDLLPAAHAAARWLLEHSTPDDNGLLCYRDATGNGLANQGWKDSGDSMRTARGEIASAPIALVEAQAYAVEAARSTADLFDALGEPGGDELRPWADALEQRIRDRFWVEDEHGRYLAMALDGNGDPVDGVGSNMGHVLGTGVLSPEEARLVADRLLRPELFAPLGIRTLSTTNPAFNPIGYHTGSIWTHDTAICAWGLAREGFGAQAVAVAASLVDSAQLFDGRWPELYSGDAVLGRPAPYPASCRPQAWACASMGAIVSALLGLDADVPGGTVRLAPPPRSPFGELRVAGLRAAGTAFEVRVDGRGEVEIPERLAEGVSARVLNGGR